MPKRLRSAALVATLMAAGAARANAVVIQTWSWQGCGGAGNPGFNTCASISINYNGGTNVLTLTVQNWGTTDPNTGTGPFSNSGNSVFADIGIANFGTGSLTGLTGNGTCTGDLTCDWSFGAPSLSNSLPGFSGAGATPPPSFNGLDAPATPGPGTYTQVVLTFGTSGTIDLSNVTFALHGISGPADPAGGNCSTKLIVTGGVANSTTSTTCDVNPIITNSVVPEPASMLLLATGLVAMGGAGFIRRRKV